MTIPLSLIIPMYSEFFVVFLLLEEVPLAVFLLSYYSSQLSLHNRLTIATVTPIALRINS